MDVQLELRFSFGRGELAEADPRFFALLRAVDEYGSLRGASEATGCSYRAAWGLLRHWTETLGRAPVELHQGRGAVLSELGRRLLWADQHAREALSPGLRQVAGQLAASLEELPAETGGRLRVHASHSMAQDILRELLAERAGLKLDFHNHGSLDSLRDLKQGDCEMAGFHLVEGPLRPALARHLKPLLDPETQRLVRVTSRRQGFMVRPGAGAVIRAATDLVARPALRFVNRQSGSGTRLLLDALLRRDGVDAARIRGYEHEEFTHSAVAALLGSGAADVGIGVEAAAARFGLDFVPLATETYYFAVNGHDVQHNPAVQALISVLAGAAFRARVARLDGYDPAHSGRREPVAALFDAA